MSEYVNGELIPYRVGKLEENYDRVDGRVLVLEKLAWKLVGGVIVGTTVGTTIGGTIIVKLLGGG